jgi:thiamine-monophosphate kinase
MTEHVDFELDWAWPEDVGFKLVAINVSDLAAMGGTPTRAVATIQVGEDTTDDQIVRVAEGMKVAADRWGLKVVGGDIGSGSELAMTLTLLGDLTGAPVVRSGARVGDAICVTGSLGAAHAGLLLLQMGWVSRDSVRAEIDKPSGADGLAVLSAYQLRPAARLDEGKALTGIATAMIDISDGFAVDLDRLCTASDVGCDVRSADLPVHTDIAYAAGKLDDFPDPLECALLGGEDFELLFTVAESDLDKVHAALDEIACSVSVVGTVTDGPRRIDGRPLEEWSESGWDHLRTQ